MKNSFVMYIDWTPLMANLPDEKAGQLIKAIFAYQMGEEVSIDDPVLASVFEMIRTVMNKDAQKYEETKKARSEAGKKNKVNQNEANDNKSNQMLTNDNKSNQKASNAHDNVNVNVNDNGYVNENVSSSDDKSPKRAEAIISKYEFSAEMKSVIEEWLKYKAEKRQSYKPTGLNNLVAEISNNVKRYGESAVSDVMRKSMAAGYQGITWNWLKEGKFNDNIRAGAKGRGSARADFPDDFNLEGWGEFT